jgi:hypothetical protein
MVGRALLRSRCRQAALTEVFILNITAYSDHDEAQPILDALRKRQGASESRDEAKIDPALPVATAPHLLAAA